MAIPSFLLFFFLFLAAASAATQPPIPPPSPTSSSSLCPFNLTYVRTIPWDTSLCDNPTASRRSHCCQTLLSLFGIGIAQHLRSTSLFQLPSTQISAACLSNFQSELQSIRIDPSLVPLCFNDSTEFVSKPSSCVGIITTADWINRVGSQTALDSSCRGDVSGLTRCSSCLDAGLKVNSQLTNLMPNSTAKCFYFTCLYAVAMVSDLGPLDAKTAGCILALPLKNARNPSNGGSNKNKNDSTKLGMILGIVFGVIGAAILAGLGVVLYRKRKVRKTVEASHEQYVSSFKSAVMPNSGARWFQGSELEKATNGFNQKNFLGKGAYGVVYKGVLPDGSYVAVKELHDQDNLPDEEFFNEVEIISKIRHRNLLSLRGCCATSDVSRGKRRFLVYDYMSNGSLGDHLANEHTRNQLTWPHRKNVVLDVAKGLAYLHHGIKPAIYHRDIKANNILLDNEMKAKVADFGLAKQSTEGQSHLTTRVAGTHGYLAPEYALYGQLTEKSDVYSFGIVVLEVMSGRKVIDTTSSSSYLLITDWAWMLVKSGKMEDVFDEAIRDQGPVGVMERFVLVGMLCAHVLVAFRPTIADALKMLEGDIDIPKLPDRPMPLSHESFRHVVAKNGGSSVSERSITNSSSTSSMA
ncbi:Probable receptor-like protein kinase At1g11050 [Linum grandiflorum]